MIINTQYHKKNNVIMGCKCNLGIRLETKC